MSVTYCVVPRLRHIKNGKILTEQPDLLMEEAFLQVWARIEPDTTTSIERAYALWTAVNTVLDNNIQGSFVECGVWRGGSAMLILLALLARGQGHREIYLFDTFEGMSAPGPHDKDLHGLHATNLMDGENGAEIAELVKAAASESDVRQAVASTGYDMRLVRLIRGDVCQTLTKTQTLGIALLRLDTDCYDSTRAELDHLYPRLAQGGVLIVDDYGHWEGARRAVDEYFAKAENGFAKPMFWRLDYTGRGAVKTDAAKQIEIERYDYWPPDVSSPNLLDLFPEALAQTPWAVQWPYLRPHVPHIWRSDQRNDTPYITGNASVEEAACLYELARQFKGKRGIEIGSHYGWTAAHLLAAGLVLDCVDPEFKRDVRVRQVSGALDKVATSGSYRLWGGFSPASLAEIRASRPEPWSFAFIDGSHDGIAPAEDARGVLPLLAADAVVVFHDLTSPDVAAGLSVFKKAGFSTRLFNTMQILGVAWRGNVTIFDHKQDPNIYPHFLPHLAEFDAS